MTSVGRPTDYKEEYNDLAFKFALLGATDEQLADALNICTTTLNNWKNLYPAFMASIKKGKTDADAEIAHALYHRAKGYSHPDVHITSYLGDVTETDIEKHYPPDTAAAFIWLKNRQGHNWKDRKETDISFDNAEEYFKTIADAITQSDTGTSPVLPRPDPIHSEPGGETLT